MTTRNKVLGNLRYNEESAEEGEDERQDQQCDLDQLHVALPSSR